MDLRIGILEDERSIREGMMLLINGSDGFSCCHAFESAEEAIVNVPLLELDVVLVDIHLSGKTGIDFISEIKPLCKLTQFVMFTSFEDSDSVFNALKAGATGYLTKTTQPSKILEALLDVSKGGSPMSSHIARKIVLTFSEENNVELQKLSEREREILALLSKGLRYKEIADQLFLSPETIRTHIRNIYIKLQVNSRTDALNKVFRK
ncbi:response regulator transcription factor [soil metagenome]